MVYLRAMSFRIAIIGTGNVAWHLSQALENAGHTVEVVFGRDIQKATHLSSSLYLAEATNKADLSSFRIDVAIICVTDDAIEEVAQALVLPSETVLCHSSGNQPLSVLGYAQTENLGVFYPLQTFTKGKQVSFEDIPICIEAEGDRSLEMLRSLGKSISKNVQELNSKQRSIIHLSAVFACNFSNHMLAISNQIMKSNDIDFQLLHPLIVETLNKSLTIGPENAQTGPAKRGDLATLDKQYNALSNDAEVAELYQMISQHILDTYSDDN